ncbi:hypothetical protein V1511DRAFT_493940 [Dipodascopsis uninucleata]
MLYRPCSIPHRLYYYYRIRRSLSYISHRFQTVGNINLYREQLPKVAATISTQKRSIFSKMEEANNASVTQATITIDQFSAIDIRVGTIVEASKNEKARKPAYKLVIDFGQEIGLKTSSAQITDYYTPQDLLGKQIIAAVNLGVRKIANVKSEVLVLGVDSEENKKITLLSLDKPVTNGSRII